MVSTAVVLPPAGIAAAELPPDHAIVLRVPNWIGDAVLALPAVAALAERFRGRRIVVLARPPIAPLFVGQEGIGEVARIGKGAGSRFAEARRALAGLRPGLGVVFPHSVGAAGELATAGIEPRWGYGGALRRLVLDVALPRRWLEGRHRWEAYAILAAAVTGRPVVERYPIPAALEDRAAADLLFAEGGLVPRGGPIVGIVPGAHAASRRWPGERFAEISSRLGRDGASVVLFGSSAERALLAGIAAAAHPRPLDWAGRTPLPVLAECFRRLDFLLTNDTGPMHLAAAVGTPLLDLCGAADERITGPRSPMSEVLVHPVHCRPCVKNECAYNLDCMRGISADTVDRLVRERLGAFC